MNPDGISINFCYISMGNSVDDLKSKKLRKNSQLTGRIVWPEKRETMRANTLAHNCCCCLFNVIDGCLVALMLRHFGLSFESIVCVTLWHTCVCVCVWCRITYDVTNGDYTSYRECMCVCVLVCTNLRQKQTNAPAELYHFDSTQWKCYTSRTFIRDSNRDMIFSVLGHKKSIIIIVDVCVCVCIKSTQSLNSVYSGLLYVGDYICICVSVWMCIYIDCTNEKKWLTWNRVQLKTEE